MHRRSAAIHRRWAGLAVLAVGGMLAAALGAPAQAADDGGPVRFVVRVAGAAPSRAEIQRSVGGLAVSQVVPLGRGVAAVTVRTADPDGAAAALDASPLVAGASPDRRFTTLGTRAPVVPGDPWFADQWDLWDAPSTERAGGYGVDAPRAWTRSTGSPSVVVAVVDTGITAHPDLHGAALEPGYDFVSSTDGIGTGDGDGWDADPADPGDACPELGEPASWHGTFVAGEIAAQHGTGGVAGEAPGVTLEPVRVLGSCGGTEADTIAAIEWASGGAVAGVPAAARPAQVVSLSLGSADGACSPALQTAVSDATARGSIVVAAAGNEGAALASTSPANCTGVVSVVASTRSGRLASYSNHGTAAVPATIAAPGGSRLNPVIGDSWTSGTTIGARGNRAALAAEAGTSMATPRVSAAIALLLSVRPGLEPAEAVRLLTASATPFPSASGCSVVRCGAGVVNAGDLVGATRRFVHATAVRVTGTARPGHRLLAHAGTWHPTPVVVAFRWLRDGEPIAGATGASYRLRARDAGHRIAVRVQVLHPGTRTARAASASRRVVS